MSDERWAGRDRRRASTSPGSPGSGAPRSATGVAASPTSPSRSAARRRARCIGLGDVERWLTHHGRAIQVSAADRVWQWLRTETDDLRLGELMGHLGAFLVFLQRGSRSRGRRCRGASDEDFVAALDHAVAAAVPELPGGLPERPDVECGRRPADRRGRRRRAGRRGDLRLPRRPLSRRARPPASQPTPARRPSVMVRAGAGDRRSVRADPAAERAPVLTAAAPVGRPRCAGRTSTRPGPAHRGPAAARECAAVRCACRRLAAVRRLRRRADSAPWSATRPFSERDWGYDELTGDPRGSTASRREASRSWRGSQHCLAHVKPGGRLVIMMPAARGGPPRGPADPRQPAACRRAPRGHQPSRDGPAAVAPDLWVLRGPDADETPPSHVLMVDASENPSRGRAWRSFFADPDRLPRTGADRCGSSICSTTTSTSARSVTSLRARKRRGRQVPAGADEASRDHRELADTLPDLTALAGGNP